VVVVLLRVLVVVCAPVLDEVVVAEWDVEVELEVEDELEVGGGEPPDDTAAKPNLGPFASKTP
jgi:hypothetical protein